MEAGYIAGGVAVYALMVASAIRIQSQFRRAGAQAATPWIEAGNQRHFNSLYGIE